MPRARRDRSEGQTHLVSIRVEVIRPENPVDLLPIRGGSLTKGPTALLGKILQSRSSRSFPRFACFRAANLSNQPGRIHFHSGNPH